MRVTPNAKNQETWQRHGLEYLRYQYKLTPKDVVIDIGAYRGEWAAEIYKRYKCKLILIEPGPWIVNCEVGEIINKAAGVKDGRQRFGGDYYYTSAYEQGTTEYETFDINGLLSQHDEIALCKICTIQSRRGCYKRMNRCGAIALFGNLGGEGNTCESIRA